MTQTSSTLLLPHVPAEDDDGSGRYAPSAAVPAEPQPTEELRPASQEGQGREAQGESPPKEDSLPSDLSMEKDLAYTKVIKELNSLQQGVGACLEFHEDLYDKYYRGDYDPNELVELVRATCQ